MDTVLTYRGRAVDAADVEFIRDLIALAPSASRRALSRKLCEAWEWKQLNGELKDMVCRGLLLTLHRGGHIELPPPRWICREPGKRLKPAPVEVDRSPVRGRLSDLGPLELRQVRRAGDEESLFNTDFRRGKSTNKSACLS